MPIVECGIESLRQVRGCRVRQSQRLRDRGCDDGGIANRRQLNEAHSYRAFLLDSVRDVESEPRLPNATGTDEGNQTRKRIGEPLLQGQYVSIAADQRCQRDG